MSSATMTPQSSLEMMETLESNPDYASMRKRFEESFYGFVESHCEKALMSSLRREFPNRESLMNNPSFMKHAMKLLETDTLLEETPTLFLSSVLKTPQNV